jgi:hypothetical protein
MSEENKATVARYFAEAVDKRMGTFLIIVHGILHHPTA